MINIYTDGSYKSSINSGGWSAIIVENDKVIKILYRGMINTTNNRQELYGVLEGLKYFTIPTEINIISDSSYIVNSINNKYLHKWIKENDLTKKNMDIWTQIYDLLQVHTVHCTWVKGHNHNKFNELADLYAQHAATCLNLKYDLNAATRNNV